MLAYGKSKLGLESVCSYFNSSWNNHIVKYPGIGVWHLSLKSLSGTDCFLVKLLWLIKYSMYCFSVLSVSEIWAAYDPLSVLIWCSIQMVDLKVAPIEKTVGRTQKRNSWVFCFFLRFPFAFHLISSFQLINTFRVILQNDFLKCLHVYTCHERISGAWDNISQYSKKFFGFLFCLCSNYAIEHLNPSFVLLSNRNYL